MGAHDVKVLAFDCSTSQGSLAVVEDGSAIFTETFDCPRGRGGAFFQVLERAIKTAGKPDRIAVGVGPGSYNGVRTAIAAGEGLRLATEAELVGIPSVCALPGPEDGYIAVSDARGGVFYFVRIRHRQVEGEFELLTGEALVAQLAEEVGAAVFTPAIIPSLPRAEVAFPDAVILARLGAAASPSTQGLKPLYLKPAHITQPRRGRPTGEQTAV